MNNLIRKIPLFVIACAVVYLIFCGLLLTGKVSDWYKQIRTTSKGVEQVTYQQVIDSVGGHSIEYEKSNIQLDAEISSRLSTDSIMLTTPNEKIWWYVRTGEKHEGHDTIYGYKKGETYNLRLYIREIEYRHFENDGKGRYYIWSEIIK